jgi:hypothetical protein
MSDVMTLRADRIDDRIKALRQEMRISEKAGDSGRAGELRDQIDDLKQIRKDANPYGRWRQDKYEKYSEPLGPAAAVWIEAYEVRDLDTGKYMPKVYIETNQGGLGLSPDDALELAHSLQAWAEAFKAFHPEED